MTMAADTGFKVVGIRKAHIDYDYKSGWSEIELRQDEEIVNVDQEVNQLVLWIVRKVKDV